MIELPPFVEGVYLVGSSAPITWHTLAHHGVTVRGPEPSTLDIHTHDAALVSWTRANADFYWRPWLHHSRFTLLRDWGVAWGVLGLSRIACTIRTADITAKATAGEWALSVYDHHAPILREALRLRRGESQRLFHSRRTRRAAAAAFMHAVLADVSAHGAEDV
ncbi:DUF4111 domain-containing protein [Dactylosporangium vinaceum]|uniref:Aminoglycoside adenylyltransferase domain-containing protein n=1 Tax=Dactylosporangium vinaceum TaxID=53362 RepID=A0ABV5MM87_9ACTN|nr:aminoglycoside adenylyltransferase domain-containing protein [Dactylosporangium vinaceum]UAB93305.1 DUF4111 domain-containing protein [Dactylosporangium vinaceum]